MTSFRIRLGALGLAAALTSGACSSSNDKAKASPSAGHGNSTLTGTQTGSTTGTGGGATTTPTGYGGHAEGGGGVGGTGGATTGAGGVTHAGGAGGSTSAGGAGGVGGATQAGGAGGTSSTGGGGQSDAGAGGAAPDGGLVSCLQPVFAEPMMLAGAPITSAAEDHAASSYAVTTAGISRFDVAGTLIWTKTFPPTVTARRVLVGADDQPVVVGSFTGSATFGNVTLTSVGGQDAFVAKLAANGNAVWAVSAGGPGDDEATDLAVDGAGNTVVTGTFSSQGATFGKTVLSTAGGSDVFLMRLDALGTLAWARSFGGPGDDYAFALGGNEAGDVVGGVYSFGTSIQFGAIDLMAGAHMEAIVYRVDGAGSPVWAKSAGGDADAWVSGIGVDKAGNAYVAGMAGGTTVFDVDNGASLTAVNGTEAFLAKYDAVGGVAWARRVGQGVLDTALQNDSAGDSVSVDPNGNAVVVGWFGGTASFGPAASPTTLKSAGGTDAFVARFDATGKLVCTLRGGGTKDDSATGISADGIGGVFVSGWFDTDAVLGGLAVSAGGKSPYAWKLQQ
jgi:hypothetical protein